MKPEKKVNEAYVWGRLDWKSKQLVIRLTKSGFFFPPFSLLEVKASSSNLTKQKSGKGKKNWNVKHEFLSTDA